MLYVISILQYNTPQKVTIFTKTNTNFSHNTKHGNVAFNIRKTQRELERRNGKQDGLMGNGDSICVFPYL